MVYYRLNYYVKSGTVTDFAPYNFFIMLIQLLHVKNPITGTIWNLHIFLNCEIYNRCLHICTYNMNYKKIKKNKKKFREHTQSYIKRKQTLSHTHCTKIVIRKLGFELLWTKKTTTRLPMINLQCSISFFFKNKIVKKIWRRYLTFMFRIHIHTM